MPLPATCNVLFSVQKNGIPVEGASVSAALESAYNAGVGFLASRGTASASTDSSGNCTLTLIQGGQFTSGGQYRIVVSMPGPALHINRLVTIPNTTTANAEDLVAV